MPYRDRLVAWLLLALCAGPTLAHEVRPGFLELRELDQRHFDILWKVPARGDRRLALYVRLPDNCRADEPATRFVGNAYVERWRADCQGGLAGRQVVIDGLEATRTDVLARVQRLDGDSQTTRLAPDNTRFTVSGSPSLTDQVKTYTGMGIKHILLGVDHLLFVLGLLWIVRGVWMLVKTITAFTVAHSLTLAAATLGWIGVPPQPVEALIALSIVFVAVEAVKTRRGEGGFAARYPWLIAFAFGLLHGLGFAAALTALGLPAGEIPMALLFFNLGVEFGQLAFVLLVLSVLRAMQRLHLRWPRGSEGIAVYLVGGVAAFWFIDRSVAMFAF
ncbi:MAG: HupE/UreJ family protein [Chromatiaceae bacterium]|nr:HupE/UreJ family protein [Chromatiaceae bacterium]MCP5312574.1 HupE/UreJ family protein [Chromatiaceae bacterium]